MKAGTTEKAKFKVLKHLLRRPEYQVVGLLEQLWQITARDAPRGDVGKLSNLIIAATLEWDGEADELVNALVQSGWLDRSEEHRLVVHDWSEHAPNYVKGNMRRHGHDFVTNGDNVVSLGGSSGECPKEGPQGTLPPSLAKPSQVKPRDPERRPQRSHRSTTSMDSTSTFGNTFPNETASESARSRRWPSTGSFLSPSNGRFAKRSRSTRITASPRARRRKTAFGGFAMVTGRTTRSRSSRGICRAMRFRLSCSDLTSTRRSGCSSSWANR